MKHSIQSLALTSALVAFTVGIAGAQGSTPAPATTPAATATAAPAKMDAKPAAAKAEKMSKTVKAPKWTMDQVKTAQEALAKGGYYKGQANGKWNGATKNALKAWQKANKMKETGQMTEEIMTKLQAS